MQVAWSGASCSLQANVKPGSSMRTYSDCLSNALRWVTWLKIAFWHAGRDICRLRELQGPLCKGLDIHMHALSLLCRNSRKRYSVLT